MKIILNKPFAANSAADEFDVRQIKTLLNRLGYYFPYEKSGITGIPDAEVFAALKAFQKDQGLQPTGAARPGDETVAQLSSIAAQKNSGKYIWRTVGDDRVRGAHAALNGAVRDFADSPDPGEEFNCRCWAEPVSKISTPPHNPDCLKVQAAFDKIAKKVEEIQEKHDQAFEKAQDAVNKANESVARAQKELAKKGLQTAMTRIPVKIFRRLSKLVERLGVTESKKETKQEFEQLSKEHEILRTKARYEVENLTLIKAQFENAKMELEKARQALEECQQSKT